MSTTLAGAPGECCFTGIKHSGTPVGTVVHIGGLETYISMPPDHVASTTDKKIIFFLADIWGPMFVNNKLIQDYFAQNGFIVLGPDYLFGDAVPDHPPDFDKDAWIPTKMAPAQAAFPKWLEAVKAQYGTENTKYCAVGYCFGAPFVLDLAASGFVEAGAIAHPAFLEESHFQKVEKPLLLCCAEVDSTFPLESRRRAEDILVERQATYHFQIFSGVKHGYAVRGDPNIERERWAKEQCARAVVEWFTRFTKD